MPKNAYQTVIGTPTVRKDIVICIQFVQIFMKLLKTSLQMKLAVIKVSSFLCCFKSTKLMKGRFNFGGFWGWRIS